MKSKGTALVLCFFLGWLGAHRFYAGRWLSGLLQMFTFGGFFVWWGLDFLVILLGKFKDADGHYIDGGATARTPAPSLTDLRPASAGTLTSTEADALGDWFMQAKPTPYWKFFVGMNFFKAYQLDTIEKKGDLITIRVQSGKTCTFRVGEFKAVHDKNQYKIRVFRIKSTAGPKQKMYFVETVLQMPEAWWDEVEKRLDAQESGISKFSQALGKVENVLENFVPDK